MPCIDRDNVSKSPFSILHVWLRKPFLLFRTFLRMTSSHVEKIALQCATICREKGMLNIERASTSMIVQRLRESKVVQSVCTAHAKASIALSSSSLEMSNVQVETSQDIDRYIVELAKKLAEAAVGMGRQLHVKDSKTLEILQKQPECFAYTF